MSGTRGTGARSGATRLRSTFFSVSPSSGEQLPALDGIRALAVLAIFARHSWGLTGSVRVVLPVPGGDIDLTPLVLMLSNGVDLFFVLSGFLLARSFISADLAGRPRPDLRGYFRSRAFRILPAYYVVLAALLVFFVPTVLQSDLVYSFLGLKTVLAHLAVLQTAFPWSYGLWGPGSPFWTLTIEVLFYLALPWLVRAFLRDRWRWGLPLFAIITFGWMWFARSTLASPLVDLIVDHGGRPGSSPEFARFFLSKQLPGHLFDFAVGMTVANLYVRARAARPGLRRHRLATPAGSAVTFLVGVAVVAVAMRQLGLSSLEHSYFDGLSLMASSNADALAFYYLEEPAMALGFGLIIAAVVLGPKPLARPFAVTPLRIFGILGYSIYLWHMPFLYLHTQMPWLLELGPGPRWLAMMGFSGAIVLALSAVTFVFVERPFIALGRRRKPEPISELSLDTLRLDPEPVGAATVP